MPMRIWGQGSLMSSYPPAVNTLFGVNASGAEYSPSVGQVFPSTSDWTYLQSKGINTVRLPIAWESIQTTLSAALNSTYLAALQAAISGANAHGIGVIVDLHNYGHYAQSSVWNSTVNVAGNGGVVISGVNVFYDGTLTTAAFADVWTRLSTALAGTSGMIGYELMNEPTGFVGVNLLGSPNGFSNTVGARNWFLNNAAVLTRGSIGNNPVNANYSPSWTLTSGSNGFGSVNQMFTFSAIPYTMSVYLKTASGTEAMGVGFSGVNAFVNATTSWTRYAVAGTPSAGSAQASVFWNSSVGHSALIANAQLELRGAQSTVTITNASPAVVSWTAHGFIANQGVFFTSTGSVNTGLTTNVVYYVVGSSITTNTFQVSAAPGGAALNTSSAGSGTITGTALAAYDPNPYLSYAQAAVTAIRAVDANTPIYVNGFEAGTASLWQSVNWDLLSLSGGKLIFAAHQYFDDTQGNGSGQYLGTFTSYGITVNAGSQDVAPFLAWVSATSASGFIGEVGVPNSVADANAQWLVLQKNMWGTLRGANVPATQWYYNSTAPFAGDTLNFAPVGGVDDPRLTQMIQS